MVYLTSAEGNADRKELFDLWVIAGPGSGLDWMCVALGMVSRGLSFLSAEDCSIHERTRKQ